MRRKLWVDEERWRLVMHTSKSYTNSALKGLYLLDISGVLAGPQTPPFFYFPDGAEPDPDCCLSVVGTERTIDLVCGTPQDAKCVKEGRWWWCCC